MGPDMMVFYSPGTDSSRLPFPFPIFGAIVIVRASGDTIEMTDTALQKPERYQRVSQSYCAHVSSRPVVRTSVIGELELRWLRTLAPYLPLADEIPGVTQRWSTGFLVYFFLPLRSFLLYETNLGTQNFLFYTSHT